jgi:hypothetical protein
MYEWLEKHEKHDQESGIGQEGGSKYKKKKQKSKNFRIIVLFLPQSTILQVCNIRQASNDSSSFPLNHASH